MGATPNLDRLVALVADKGGTSYPKTAEDALTDDDMEQAHQHLRKTCPWYEKASAGAPVADFEQHCQAAHGSQPPKLVVKLTPHTAEASTVDKPTRPPGGPGLFHVKGLHLPPYIQHLWFHLVKEYGEKKAYGVAVGVVKKWAAGINPGGKHPTKTHPDVKAAASKNVAQWEEDRAKAHEQAARTANRDKSHVKATVELAATMSKPEANYRGGGTAGHCCGDCSMACGWKAPDFESSDCSLVMGLVEADHVCDHYEPDRKAVKVSLAAPGAGAEPFDGDQMLPLPRTPADAKQMFTAHRVNDIRVSLAHAAERMGAARKAPTPEARGYQMRHIYNHLVDSLNHVHQLMANLRDNYAAEGRELEAMRGLVGLAKSVSPAAKASTTAHLTETISNELTHAKRHADLMLTGKPDTEWNFNADHCQKHLAGATEHAAKLAAHLLDNYPTEAKWLKRLQLAPGEPHEGAPSLMKSVHLSGLRVELDASGTGGLAGGAVVTAPGAMKDFIPPPTGGKYSQYGLHQKPSQTVSPSPPLPPSVPMPTPDEVRKLISDVPESHDVSLSNSVKNFLESAAVKLEKNDELGALAMLRSAVTAVFAAHKADIGSVMPAFYTAGVFSKIPPAEQSSAGQAILEAQKQRNQWRELHFAVQTLADRIRKRYFHGQYNGPTQMARFTDGSDMGALEVLLVQAEVQEPGTALGRLLLAASAGKTAGHSVGSKPKPNPVAIEAAHARAVLAHREHVEHVAHVAHLHVEHLRHMAHEAHLAHEVTHGATPAIRQNAALNEAYSSPVTKG